MEQLKAVPSLSPAESEAFRRTGSDARAAMPGSDPETIQQNCAAVVDCSHNASLAALDGRDSAGDAPLPLRELAGGDIAGVDMPGVGHVRAVNIPGSVYVEGEVPGTLRAFLDDSRGLGHAPESESRILRRASLLIRLIYASRDLAELNVVPGRHGYPTSWCSECLSKIDGLKKHAEACRTGRVAAILDGLRALDGGIAKLEVHNPDTEEAAADEGDGIRPRGIRLTDAARSLRNAALEELVQVSGSLTWQCNVCGSSVTGLDKAERDILHGCDCWVGNALVVLESDDLEGGAR